MSQKKFSYESMGTKWEISVWDESGNNKIKTCLPARRELKEEIIKISEEFDKTYSRFKPDSLVSQISKNAGKYKVPEDFLKMLKLYLDLYEPSEKKLNPLIGFAISDLGYDANYSLKEKEVIRKVPDLFETVEILSTPLEDAHQGEVFIKTPTLFDFGALGKGYFVDKISSFLKEKGFERFLVNGSGDTYYFGEEFASFGLEDPDDPKKIIGKLEIGGDNKLRAFCASGINRRRWNGKNKELNHELDATTLEPAEFIKAVWVQAETCAMADALATCLFFCPPENFAKYEFEYLIMNKTREVKLSSNLKTQLY